MRPARVTWLLWLALSVLAAGCGEGSPPASEPEARPAADAGAQAQAQAPESASGDGAATLSSESPLGMWVLCEGSQQVLEHPERVPELLRTARRLGVSDLFVQVYRGGRAWFDSSYADAGPYRSALAANGGGDPLAALIERAHAEGLRVHAWVNVLSLASNRDAPILDALGEQAVHVDRRGRSVLDYPDLELPPPDREFLQMGTPAVWLDPAVPGVADWLAATFRELPERYPGLDGLHLDYIRHPDVLPFIPGSRFRVGLDFGYGAASRARFRAETGLRAPFRDRRANANAWDDWRRDRVTDLVQAIREAARAAQPDLALSAAVWAYPERAYLSLYQDWRRWVDDGLLDLVVPMLYTTDDRLLRYGARDFAGGVGGDRLWLGLGAWLFRESPARAVSQLRAARRAGTAGQVLFSYDSIADAPELAERLALEAIRVR